SKSISAAPEPTISGMKYLPGDPTSCIKLRPESAVISTNQGGVACSWVEEAGVDRHPAAEVNNGSKMPSTTANRRTVNLPLLLGLTDSSWIPNFANRSIL